MTDEPERINLWGFPIKLQEDPPTSPETGRRAYGVDGVFLAELAELEDGTWYLRSVRCD